LRDLPSFPTRRSSDLGKPIEPDAAVGQLRLRRQRPGWPQRDASAGLDRLRKAETLAVFLQRPAAAIVQVAVKPSELGLGIDVQRSEEHTSELQSRENL